MSTQVVHAGGMLLLVTGASGSGKSSVLPLVAKDFAATPTIVCADFDSIGVPDNADVSWRHSAIEQWVRSALEAQAAGRNMVLFGQVAMGELLAAPSANLLDRIDFCLLRCSPQSQRSRLKGRGYAPQLIEDHVAFGEWLYRHALDASYRPEVVVASTTVPMRWDRWVKAHTMWQVEMIDTDALTTGGVATAVEAWVRATI